jgi:hypothetical protein
MRRLNRLDVFDLGEYTVMANGRGKPAASGLSLARTGIKAK